MGAPKPRLSHLGPLQLAADRDPFVALYRDQTDVMVAFPTQKWARDIALIQMKMDRQISWETTATLARSVAHLPMDLSAIAG